MLLLAASTISTLNRKRQNILNWCEGKTKKMKKKKEKMRAETELRQPVKAFYRVITEWQIPLTLTCHQLHADVCVWVCSVTSATHNFLLVPLSGGTSVWGPECLSDCRVPAGILSVILMAPASPAALMGEPVRRWSHPSLPIRVNWLCLLTQLHLATWFAVEKRSKILCSNQLLLRENCV